MKQKLNKDLPITVLSIDPSGNHKEGKGVTGWFKGNFTDFIENGEFGRVYSKDHENPMSYWEAVTDLITDDIDTIVIEGYILYNLPGQSASVQSWSELETVQLIGILKYVAKQKDIPVYIQFAKDVKVRWSEKIMAGIGVITTENGKTYYYNDKQITDHERDALKHYLHFSQFTYWKDKK